MKGTKRLVFFLLCLFLASCGKGREATRTGQASDLSEPGAYRVGNMSFILEDPDRPLGCGPGSRRLVVEAWYPAVDHAGQWPENHVSDFMLNQLEAAIERFGEDGVNDLPTGSFRDAPVHPGAVSMPILIFSHGFDSNRFQNATMANHLASHGFLVVSPDHTCNAMIAPLPDGAVFFSFFNVPFSLGERMGDVRFLIDIFTGEPPAMFEGRLDAAKVGIWGHSFGGMTVIETVKTEPRVSAMLQLAAFGFPGVPEDVDLPSMYLWGKQDKMMHPFAFLHDQAIEEMPPPKYVLDFFDTGHFAFSDLCRFIPDFSENADGCGSGTRIETGEPFENPGHEAMLEILNPYALAFFGATLLDLPACVEYLKTNPFPDRIEVRTYTE